MRQMDLDPAHDLDNQSDVKTLWFKDLEKLLTKSENSSRKIDSREALTLEIAPLICKINLFKLAQPCLFGNGQPRASSHHKKNWHKGVKWFQFPPKDLEYVEYFSLGYKLPLITQYDWGLIMVLKLANKLFDWSLKTHNLFYSFTHHQ